MKPKTPRPKPRLNTGGKPPNPKAKLIKRFRNRLVTYEVWQNFHSYDEDKYTIRRVYHYPQQPQQNYSSTSSWQWGAISAEEVAYELAHQLADYSTAKRGGPFTSVYTPPIRRRRY